MTQEQLKDWCFMISPIKLSVTKNVEELSFKSHLLEKTNFLDIYLKVPLKLRYYCVLNDIYMKSQNVNVAIIV